MTIRLDVVTAEQVIFSSDVDIIVAPGIEGQLGILPHHAPLITALEPGELRVTRAGENIYLAIGGGYLEVRRDGGVIILADTAERAEEIDITRAEAAKLRAQEQLRHPASIMERTEAEAALHRALSRLEVASVRKKRKPQV